MYTIFINKRPHCYVKDHHDVYKALLIDSSLKCVGLWSATKSRPKFSYISKSLEYSGTKKNINEVDTTSIGEVGPMKMLEKTEFDGTVMDKMGNRDFTSVFIGNYDLRY